MTVQITYDLIQFCKANKTYEVFQVQIWLFLNLLSISIFFKEIECKILVVCPARWHTVKVSTCRHFFLCRVPWQRAHDKLGVRGAFLLCRVPGQRGARQTWLTWCFFFCDVCPGEVEHCTIILS